MNDFALPLLENLPIPIAVVTETGGVTYSNRIFRETFGAGAGEWISKAPIGYRNIRKEGGRGSRGAPPNVGRSELR